MYISKYIVRLQSDYSHHRYGVARHVMNGVLFDLPGCALTERARKPPSPTFASSSEAPRKVV